MVFRQFIYVLCALALVGACVPVPVNALTSDFTVRTRIVDPDSTPPTAPDPLTATPVAISQINLSWGTSTDANEIGGYQVFRDGLFISTTTVTLYADTGLSPSTTYSYYVIAFDEFNNFSTSSVTVSTTTLDVVVVPPPGPSSTSTTRYGSRIPYPEIVRLEVVPSKDGVRITYETKGFVRSVIRWGETVSYELGSLQEQRFSTTHETIIHGLSPGHVYQFTIEGENAIGRTAVLATRSFSTLPPNDIFPPGNVSDLSVRGSGSDLMVTWVNPSDPDLAKVRVVASDQFYPGDPLDGWVVYEGKGTAVRDQGAMPEPGAHRFYTVFSYDALGNISSGAVTKFSVRAPGETAPVLQPITTTTPEETPPELNPLKLSFSDIEFYQNDQKRSVRGVHVEIDGSDPLLISVPYARFPEHLKTILVTLTDATEKGKTMQFLLRVNKEKTAYTAYLAPLGVQGIYGMRVSVFDYKTAQIGSTEGQIHSDILTSVRVKEEESGSTPSFADRLLTLILSTTWSYVLLFILLLALLTFCAYRLLRARW